MSLGNFVNDIRSCNYTTMEYDKACLVIITKENVTFWSQYEECEGCILLPTKNLPTSGTIILSTLSPVRYAVENGAGQICNGTYQFGEFGHYSLNLSEVTKDTCLPRTTAEPVVAHLPILIAVVVLLFMAILWNMVNKIGKRIIAGRLYARYFAKEALATEESVPRPPPRPRLRSLDTFRGLTVALMIFVNMGGGGYAVFKHSSWYGLTVADVVRAWFAFAMGQALVLSLGARLRAALPRLTALKQMTRRALLMSLAGIVLHQTFVTWANVRLPNVLQRLAAIYLICGALECAFMRTTQNIKPGCSLFRDISAGWQQWLATLSLVAVQVCVSLAVAAPGCPRGYMGPGGLHLSAQGHWLKNCTGGIAGYIDRSVLGESHMYKWGEFQYIYYTSLRHEPQGLLGILSGVLVVQAGAHATRIMLAYNDARARITRWVFWSIIFGATGGALCAFTGHGGPIPIIMNLWSVSYCLVTAAMAFMIQAVLYFIVDLKTMWGGRPLYYAGQNSFFLYIGSELLKYHFPLHVEMVAPRHWQLLAANIGTTLIWLAVAAALHRARIFIRI